MLWRVRGKDQYNFTKRGWHKGVLSAGMGMVYGSLIGAGGGILGGLLGGGKKGSAPTYNLPEFEEDPYYKQAQDILYPTGKGLLAGKPSEYYAPIGEIGGQLFEDVLGMGRRDITKSITEDFARRNIRGARGAPVIGKAVGEYTKKARFDDYMRALQGRQFLLGAGADITSGVRAGGLTSQAQRATYEVSKGNLALGYAGLASREEQAKGEAMGAGIGGGLKGLANIYAMSQLGKVDSGTSSVYDTAPYERYSLSNIPSLKPDPYSGYNYEW